MLDIPKLIRQGRLAASGSCTGKFNSVRRFACQRLEILEGYPYETPIERCRTSHPYTSTGEGPVSQFRQSDRAAALYRPLTKLAKWESSAIVEFVARGFGAKADGCADALAAARNLANRGKRGPAYRRLVVRAAELLDEIDAILGVLDPAKCRYQFATGASLHRELAELIAAEPGEGGALANTSTGARTR